MSRVSFAKLSIRAKVVVAGANLLDEHPVRVHRASIKILVCGPYMSPLPTRHFDTTSSELST